MDFLKNNGKMILTFLISILIVSFILNLLFYFNMISITMVRVIFWLFSLGLFLFIGIKSGIRSERKGYISGLLKGLAYLIIIFILSIIIGVKMGLLVIFYYITLIFSCIAGGMIGINKKDKK